MAKLCISISLSESFSQAVKHNDIATSTNVLINVCSIIIPIVYGISSGLIKKNKYLTIENSNNNSEFSRSSSETKIDENLSELIHI